jgi:hypothetical protein
MTATAIQSHIRPNSALTTTPRIVEAQSRIPNPTTDLGWGRDSDLTSRIVTETTTNSLLARLDDATAKIVRISAPVKARSILFFLMFVSDDCKDRGCPCSRIIPPLTDWHLLSSLNHTSSGKLQ